jgi:hypothetical protein
MKSLLKYLFARSNIPTRHSTPRRRSLLQVEGLEDRLLMSASPLHAVAARLVVPAPSHVVASAPEMAISPVHAPQSVAAHAATSAARSPNALTNDTLAQNIGTSNNSINVNGYPADFPQNAPFYIKIDGEVMKVTKVYTNIGSVGDLSFDVVRGVNGIDTTHTAGAGITVLLNFQPVNPPPGVPQGFSAHTVSATEIDLSWGGVAGATSYVLYYLTSTGGQPHQFETTTSTYARITGLAPSSTYIFEVAAQNSNGVGYQSSPATATTLAAAASPPATPTNFGFSALSTTQINLHWTGSAGATGYEVQYYNGSGWVNFYATSATNLTVTVAHGYYYYFRVAAYNSVGPSPYTNYVAAIA